MTCFSADLPLISRESRTRFNGLVQSRIDSIETLGQIPCMMQHTDSSTSALRKAGFTGNNLSCTRNLLQMSSIQTALSLVYFPIHDIHLRIQPLALLDSSLPSNQKSSVVRSRLFFQPLFPSQGFKRHVQFILPVAIPSPQI